MRTRGELENVARRAAVSLGGEGHRPRRLAKDAYFADFVAVRRQRVQTRALTAAPLRLIVSG
jgi:hypothetical protein